MKYNSTIGQGIGKNADGIVKPIKANLKFDQAGLSFDKAKEFTDHWWERVFDNAADNLNVNDSSFSVKESNEVIFHTRAEMKLVIIAIVFSVYRFPCILLKTMGTIFKRKIQNLKTMVVY